VSRQPSDLDDRKPSPLEERLVAYLDGELDDAEAREVEQLLASDAGARELLSGLERTWSLLEKLGRSPVDQMFARTTIEMVSVAAADDAAKQQAEIPRLQRRRRLIGAAGLLAAAIVGFLAVVLALPNPNRELLEDLPVLEDLDEFERVLNKDEDIQFLKLLQENHLFVKDAADDS
jgi:anti-sigma factor RsiW